MAGHVDQPAGAHRVVWSEAELAIVQRLAGHAADYHDALERLGRDPKEFWVTCADAAALAESLAATAAAMKELAELAERLGITGGVATRAIRATLQADLHEHAVRWDRAAQSYLVDLPSH
jgi:hypothetical protein